MIAFDAVSTITEALSAQQRLGCAQLCALVDEEEDTLALSAESHILISPETTPLAEVENTQFSALTCAAELERRIFRTDELLEDRVADEAGA